MVFKVFVVMQEAAAYVSLASHACLAFSISKALFRLLATPRLKRSATSKQERPGKASIPREDLSCPLAILVKPFAYSLVLFCLSSEIYTSLSRDLHGFALPLSQAGQLPAFFLLVLLLFVRPLPKSIRLLLPLYLARLLS